MTNPLDAIFNMPQPVPLKCGSCETSVGLVFYEDRYWCPDCLWAEIQQLRKELRQIDD